MKEATCNKIQRARFIFGAFGITALMLLILSNTANAATILEMSPDPLEPVGNQEVTLYFKVTPAEAGTITLSGEGIPDSEIPVDEFGYASKTFSAPDQTGNYHMTANFMNGNNDHKCGCECDIDVVPGCIPEFPSFVVPVVAMLGIFFILGRRIK